MNWKWIRNGDFPLLGVRISSMRRRWKLIWKGKTVRQCCIFWSDAVHQPSQCTTCIGYCKSTRYENCVDSWLSNVHECSSVKDTWNILWARLDTSNHSASHSNFLWHPLWRVAFERLCFTNISVCFIIQYLLLFIFILNPLIVSAILWFWFQCCCY